MNFIYSNLSLKELIEKISKSRYFNLPKMVSEALNRLELTSQTMTQHIEASNSTIQGIQATVPYKEFFFKCIGQGIQPTLVFTDTFDTTPVFSSGGSGSTVLTVPGFFIDLDRVLIDNGSTVIRPNPVLTQSVDAISVTMSNGDYIKIRVYN